MLIIPFCILFGLLLDGLFNIGHMLSFGFASIISLLIFNSQISLSIRRSLLIFSVVLMCFNGFLKFSQYMGVYYYEKQNFYRAAPYFVNLVNYYPIKIGKYHAYLGVCYLEMGDFEKSINHYRAAKEIIPNNANILKLGKLLEGK